MDITEAVPVIWPTEVDGFHLKCVDLAILCLESESLRVGIVDGLLHFSDLTAITGDKASSLRVHQIFGIRDNERVNTLLSSLLHISVDGELLN